MQLIVAKSAGFCYGVRRAVHMAESAAPSGRPFLGSYWLINFIKIKN